MSSYLIAIMTLLTGRNKRRVSCPCACCANGRETPVPRYFLKEYCCIFEETTLFVEFYVVGIRLYIRVLSESPPLLETLSELATDHAHYFTLDDDDQLHYMEMMARWVFVSRGKEETISPRLSAQSV